MVFRILPGDLFLLSYKTHLCLWVSPFLHKETKRCPAQKLIWLSLCFFFGCYVWLPQESPLLRNSWRWFYPSQNFDCLWLSVFSHLCTFSVLIIFSRWIFLVECIYLRVETLYSPELSKDKGWQGASPGCFWDQNILHLSLPKFSVWERGDCKGRHCSLIH